MKVLSCFFIDKFVWWVIFDIGKFFMKIFRYNDVVFNVMFVWFVWFLVVYFNWCKWWIVYLLVFSYYICNINLNVGDICKIIKL